MTTANHARNSRTYLVEFVWLLIVLVVPLILALKVLGIWAWDLSVPLIYRNADDIWQLTLTKMLCETGWVLTNPSLGAPDVAHWYNNAAAQTSALHSVLMLGLSKLIDDPVRVQQTYYLLNFSLISLTSFVACRLLGVSHLPAACVGILFSFTTYRIDEMLLAFLANYFMVPLALVAVVWVISGHFLTLPTDDAPPKEFKSDIKRIILSRDFWLGLLFVMLMAMSDGYYAFFTLLLLGFASFARLLLGDWKHPATLAPVVIYISALMAVALALQVPLIEYKRTHINEFYPNGLQDPALVKHPFEAEVYSSTLKMMIAPIQYHHIPFFGKIGKAMVATSDAARKYENGRTLVPLGTLGSMLFAIALVLVAVPTLRKTFRTTNTPDKVVQSYFEMQDGLLALIFFIFITSILGGVGTLVALVYPTIRAYDRFPLFLIFVLYLWGALYITNKVKSQNNSRRAALWVLLVILTAASLYDQIPANAKKGSEQSKNLFLAERSFVKRIEGELPTDAMVFQLPYSQYLRNNKYYGWGSFSYIRLYLNSHHLRWSNGGAKNSPADDWNYRISLLPIPDLVAEVEAVGFKGLVIDRSVLSTSEYKGIRDTLIKAGYPLQEDGPSNYTFVKLFDPGYKVTYTPSYNEIERITIVNPKELLKQEYFPTLINGVKLKRLIAAEGELPEQEITRSDHPELFFESSVIMRGLGETPISPITDMRGRMSCARGAFDAGTVTLTLDNKSDFDWQLGAGSLPIRIGVHLLQSDGSVLQFDNGYRVPVEAYVPHGKSYTASFPALDVPVTPEQRNHGPLVAEFTLVQDGVAWFGNVSCKVSLP